MAVPEASATRRTVTIVFADLTGSTTIGERMDPEALRALMGPFYAAMRAQVESRGGRIAKFQGDGVMAVFGLDEVHEDDAVRALTAAVAMQDAVADLPVTHDVMLSLKVGVNTGEVVSSAGDEDLVGDAVNVASRFEGAAAPGDVIAGEETWRLTRSIAVYDAIAPLTLKGKAEPVPAYRLVSLEGAEEAETSAVPFVGREAEIARLMEAFDDVLHNSAAGSVTIVGSPGLGKTRLTGEFAQRLQGRALVIETRCDAASSYAFAPVAEALRTAGGIEESAEPEIVLERVTELIPEAEPERDRIARLIAALLGAGSPASTEETFWAIRRMIEIAAATTPVVQILDDMHWAEPVLLDLIEHLIEWVRDVPLLVVVTGRPELREIRPSLTERAITLEGLDESSTGLLARELLGGHPLPAELLARLPSSTEGNPLFVRELVRMLVDDGVLRRTDDGWRVTIDVDAIDVPPTIHSLLSARVDRLRPEERSVVELASVIGREFYKGALLELAPMSLRPEIDVHLESLRRKELVEPSGTYWIDEPVYRFHHVLIRDAAYRRLLKESRAELHGTVAAWLERKTAGLVGEHDELIGYHLEQAHASLRQLGPLDDRAREIGRRAASLLGTAARRALDRDDLPSAASQSRRALAVLDERDDARPELLIVRCEALLGMGDVTTATPVVHELRELAAASARLSHWATCFTGQLANLSDPERLHEMKGRVAGAASALASLGDIGGAAKAHTVHAATLARLGRFAECETALDDALTAAREVGDRGRVTAVLEALPQAQLWGPNVVSRAGGRCLDVVRLVRITTQSPAVEATSIRCQAVLEALRGRSDPARGMLRKVRRIQQELGLRHGLFETELSHGVIELLAGDAAAAEEHLRIAHEGFLEMGIGVMAAQAAALRARARLAMGEEADADALAAESEKLGGDDLKTAIAWRAVRAEILSRRGNHDEARRLAERAVELAVSTDALIDHGDALMALAAVHRRAGDAAAARKAEDRAIALYERKGATALAGREPAVVPAPTDAASTPVETAVTRMAAGFERALIARDWEALRELYSPDVIGEDRRATYRAVWTGRAEFMRMTEAVASIGVTKLQTTWLDVRGERLGLRRTRFSNAADPNSFEDVVLCVDELDDAGRLRRMVIFNESELDAARAELDALEGLHAQTEGAALENAAARAIARFEAAFYERDWDAVRDMFAENARGEERRPGVPSTLSGRDEWIEMLRALAAVGVTRVESAYIACRGDRLALRRARFTNADDPNSFESVVLILDEIDGDGRICRMTTWDETDAGAAMAELDRRADAVPAASSENAATRATSGLIDALLAQDWQRYAEVVSDDVVIEDRRSALQVSIAGRSALIAVHKEMMRIGANRIENIHLAVRGDRLALRRERLSSESDPESFESVHLVVDEVDATGRVARMIVFEEKDAASARAELDARARSLETSRSVERAAAGVDDMVGTRDWDRAADLFRSEATLEDRRAGLGDTRRGRDAVVDALKAYASLGDLRTDLAWAAFRGDRLGLRRLRFPDPSDPQAPRYEALNLYEVDPAGMICHVVMFDDVDEAVDELDKRFIARASSDVTETLRFMLEAFRHSRASDWNAIAPLLSDDFVLVDHRLAYLGELTGAEWLTAQKTWQDIADLASAVIDVPRVAPGMILAELAHTGHATHGQEVDVGNFVLATFRSGRITSIELFGSDARDAALTRFDEARPGSGHALENAATRAIDRFTYHVHRGESETPLEPNADDIEFSDRRSGLNDHRQAKAGMVEINRSIADVGAREVSRATLAIRGDRLALERQEFVGQDFEVAVLRLVEIDERGLMSGVVVFDEDDLDDAIAELDARWIAHGGPARARNRLGVEMVDAINASDWERLRGLMSDDVVYTDHRPGSFGTLGVEEYIERCKALEALGRGFRIHIVRTIDAPGRPDGVLVLRRGGLDEHGNPVRWDYLGLGEEQDGRIARFETFSIEQLDQALERARELTADASTIENDSAAFAEFDARRSASAEAAE